MTHDPQVSLSRRTLLGFGASAALLAACNRTPGAQPEPGTFARSPYNPWVPPRPLSPTPGADEGDAMPPAPVVCQPTADNIEGPFFKPGAPPRAALVSVGDDGERLKLSGAVLSTDCQPLSGAQIEIWHANARGDYDLDGFRFRGQLVTAADGAFALATIIPGRYLNGRRYRPAHIHVKLSARGHKPLTTQLYFEGDPYNRGDDFIRPSLIMELNRAQGIALARYDFVLNPVDQANPY